MPITYYSDSIAGKEKNNEDFIIIKPIYDYGFFTVLADGMSSCDNPAYAAEFVAKQIVTCFDDSNPHSSIKNALLFANDSLRKEIINKNCKLGCAVSVLYITPDEITFASMGNVRIIAYLKNGTSLQLTNDDIFVADNGNQFLSVAINGRKIENLCVQSTPTQDYCAIRICSDGYYNQDPLDDSTYALFSF